MENKNMPIHPCKEYTTTVVDNIVQSQDICNHSGLSKREYFTAMAMQGMLANNNRRGGWKEFAIESVACADALLKALETPKQ